MSEGDRYQKCNQRGRNTIHYSYTLISTNELTQTTSSKGEKEQNISNELIYAEYVE